MKDEQEFEMRRRLMEIDRTNVIRVIGMVMYGLFALVILSMFTSCGAAKEICPHGTIKMGCNLLVGYEKEDNNNKTVDQKLVELEEKNKELEQKLDTTGTGFEEEIETLRETLEQENTQEIGEVTDRIDRLKEIIDNLIEQLDNKKDKKPKKGKGKKND